jgi:hypothetical protein
MMHWHPVFSGSIVKTAVLWSEKAAIAYHTTHVCMCCNEIEVVTCDDVNCLVGEMAK